MVGVTTPNEAEAHEADRTPASPLENPPRKGTLERAVFDAMHARWCGVDCPPTCAEWNPDLIEQRVAIATVKNWAQIGDRHVR